MSRGLRILHLTLGADAGGLSRYIVDLCTAMHAQGHSVAVAGDTGAWQWAFQQSPVPYINIPLKGGLLAFGRCVRMLREHLRENPVDVLHTHYRRATLLARRLQNRAAPPILYTVHLSHISLAFPRSLFTDFGDATHVASEEARDWLVNDAGVQPRRIHLIPHGVDTDRYSLTTCPQRAAARRLLDLNDDDRVALYVGRLNYPKNEEWILDVAVAVPGLKVILVGEGPHESILREGIAARNLSDRVRVAGHQDPLVYYRAADALLLPSIREGFSLVCAEAMSTGVPCLRTRTSGTRELIVEGITGRSVPIDHDQFVQASVDFLTDTDALRRMGRAGADLVREKFSFGLQLSRTLDLYRSMTKVSEDQTRPC
ncbi:MAG: glycosyltransferase family 4 protein [Tepidisphaeraceae bacterium]